MIIVCTAKAKLAYPLYQTIENLYKIFSRTTLGSTIGFDITCYEIAHKSELENNKRQIKNNKHTQ